MNVRFRIYILRLRFNDAVCCLCYVTYLFIHSPKSICPFNPTGLEKDLENQCRSDVMAHQDLHWLLTYFDFFQSQVVQFVQDYL